MGFHKKIKKLRWLRKLLPAHRLAFLSFALLLLIPPWPFTPGTHHWIERRESLKGKEGLELIRIYSVVKKQRVETSDSWAWAVSWIVLEESKRHALDPLLVLAVIAVESSFQDTATSVYGARGLMQILPDTASDVAAQRRSLYRSDHHNNHNLSNLHDPIVNIKLGVFYLHWLKKRFSNLQLALTAYNRGPTEVRNRLLEKEGVPLGYAMKVLTTYQSYRRDARQAN